MGLFDDIIEKNDNIVSNSWIEWKHASTAEMSHCQICAVLDNCWFNKSIMPKLPQHEKCHCTANKIAAPTENIVSAECPINKFTGYIFSEKYVLNGKKALFELLGFTINDSEMLQKEFEKQARKCYANSEYKLGILNENGQHIDIEIVIERTGFKPAKFVSGWMVRSKGKITNNTPLGG